MTEQPPSATPTDAMPTDAMPNPTPADPDDAISPELRADGGRDDRDPGGQCDRGGDVSEPVHAEVQPGRRGDDRHCKRNGACGDLPG